MLCFIYIYICVFLCVCVDGSCSWMRLMEKGMCECEYERSFERKKEKKNTVGKFSVGCLLARMTDNY